jgi:hypothetical protein
MHNRNQEAIWDRSGEVPSAFSSEASKPSLASKLEGFFYTKLQYRGSVNQAERSREQPNPRTTDIYRQTDAEGEREES